MKRPDATMNVERKQRVDATGSALTDREKENSFINMLSVGALTAEGRYLINEILIAAHIVGVRMEDPGTTFPDKKVSIEILAFAVLAFDDIPGIGDIIERAGVTIHAVLREMLGDVQYGHFASSIRG